MSSATIRFVVDGTYGVVSIEHPALSEGEAQAVLQSQLDFDKLHRQIYIHATQSSE